MTIRARIVRTIAGFGAAALAALLVAPLIGSTSISLFRAFDTSIPFADNVDAQILLVARLPRTLAIPSRRRSRWACRRARRSAPCSRSRSAGR